MEVIFADQALVASGVTDEYRVREYLHKLDRLLLDFKQEYEKARLNRAILLNRLTMEG